MKSLTYQIEEYLAEHFPELKVAEVFQVYQGNASLIIAEVMDYDGKEFIVKINQGRVTAANSTDSTEYFLQFVEQCNI